MQVTKLVPVPDLSNKAFPETKKYEQLGLHRTLYTFSMEDYRQAGIIFNGPHPEDNSPLEVVFGAPEGFPAPDLEEEPQVNAAGAVDIDPEMFKDVARKLGVDVQQQSNLLKKVGDKPPFFNKTHNRYCHYNTSGNVVASLCQFFTRGPFVPYSGSV